MINIYFSSELREPPVYLINLSVNEAAIFFRAYSSRHCSYFLWLALAFRMYSVVVFPEHSRELSHDESGCDPIHSDVIVDEFLSQPHDHVVKRSLSHIIDT